MNIRDMSDEELMKIAGMSQPAQQGAPNIQNMSDEELMKIAGEAPNKKQDMYNRYSGMHSEALPFMDQMEPVPMKRQMQEVAQGASNAALAPFNLAQLYRLVGDKKKSFRLPILPRGDDQGLGQMLGAALTPMPFIGKASEALLPLLAGKAPGALRTLGAHAGSGAAQGALMTGALGETTAPEQPMMSKLMGAGAGGLLGGGIGAVAGAVPTGANMYLGMLNKNKQNASNMGRAPEEVAKMEQWLPKEGRFNLSELAQHPGGQKFYTNYLGKVPFSGVKDMETKALNEAVGLTDKTVKDLLGKTEPGNVLKELQGAVKSQHDIKKKSAAELYKDTFSAADKEGFKLNTMPETAKGAEKFLKENEEGLVKTLSASDAALLLNLAGRQKGKGTEMVNDFLGKVSPEMRTQIENQLNLSKPFTLKQAQDARSKLLKEARKAELSKDDARARMLNKLAGFVEKDMESQVAAFGKPDLLEKLKNSNKFYKEEYVPYGKESDIRKIIKERSNLQSIPRTLLKDTNKKVFEDLSPENRNLIGYSLLENAIKNEGGNLRASPLGFNQRLETIPRPLQEKLFTPEQLEQFNRQNILAKSTGHGAGARGIHFTGYQGAEQNALMKWLGGLLGGGAAVGGAALTGSVLPIAAALATSAAAKTAGRVMTSPVTRKAYTKGEKISGEFEKELMKDIKEGSLTARTLAKAKTPTERALLYYLGSMGAQQEQQR